MQIIKTIQNRIYEIRGERIILDRDLAELYDVPVKSLNQAVKRNIIRFPTDFMFQLSREEYDFLRFEFQAFEKKKDSAEALRLQIVTIETPVIKAESVLKGRGKFSKYLPYAFTEYGIGMLSSVLNSEKAVLMNIAIMRAFGEIRKIALKQADISEKLKAIQQKLGEHDVQLSGLYDAIENILDENAFQRRWENREPIGFKK
jgi:hypothetical protein